MSVTFKYELDDETYQHVERLSEEGNVLVDKNDFDGALKKFNLALDLLPSPKKNWEAALWLYASIGDMYLFRKEFVAAKNSFFEALNCPDGQGSPFVHLRLGESLYELKEEEKAVDHLLRAYMLEGKEIFVEEEDKYFNFLKERVEL
jgi:tetratricopeptide (TPR) repeat protein